MKLNRWIITFAIGLAALHAWATLNPPDRGPELDASAVEALRAELERVAARSTVAERRSRELEVAWMRERAASPLPARGLSAPVTTARAAPLDAPRDEEGRCGDRDAAAAAEEPSRAPPVETRLAEAFATEDADPEWSEDASNRAVTVFSAALPAGSSIRDVDCRGSLCRVEIRHGSREAHAALLEALMQTPGFWDGPGSLARTTDESGAEVTLAFLGRPGAEHAEGSIWH